MSDNKSAIFEDVLSGFLNRRNFLRGAGLLGVGSVLPGCSPSDTSSLSSPTSDSSSKSDSSPKSRVSPESLTFTELPHGLDHTVAVAEGYNADVLLRWGDPIFEGLQDFDPLSQTAEQQRQRFGYNNDFVGFIPLPLGSDSSTRGLLAVNHEYTNSELMFPLENKGGRISKEQVDIEIAAHGLSVVEIYKQGDKWQVDLTSPYNRRITADTPMRLSGPAAGHERVKTIASLDGVDSFGTYGNCAGGVTPWGTVLTGEENVNYYFYGDYKKCDEVENYHRFGFRGDSRQWGKFHDRWDLAKNPQEPMHVGWIVEIDPLDPKSTPLKRTAMGRFKHEGANVFLNDDGYAIAYMGDDSGFEYIYKFISRDTYQPDNREANLRLLEEGTLYVAKFKDDGSLQWLSMLYGAGELTEANGFSSQADVCLDTRKAADLLGATPMDRPEDVDVNPVNGHVYAMLTNNSGRSVEQIDKANPRPHNQHGQIIDFWPESGDHTDDIFVWDLFLLAGKPGDVITKYHPDISDNGWLSCPDNCAFDCLGNIWIATDGAERLGVADGIWASELDGTAKALTKRFLRTPKGAELCGPFFTPNSESLFCSVQHPGNGSTYENPTTRWPDFDERMPPRPSLLAITKQGGGRIGT
ncbi:MAG: secreted PhoX family phosphatase [Flavobacteriales bacterium]